MSSSRRRSRSRGGAKPKPKPYKFKARPAPKTNVKSSFSELKRIVDMPLAAGLAQVESGFRAVVFDTAGNKIGRVVVQVDATLQTVRQLVKMFLLKGKQSTAPYSFLNKEGERVPRRAEREVQACTVLCPPEDDNTLPAIHIEYGSNDRGGGSGAAGRQ